MGVSQHIIKLRAYRVLRAWWGTMVQMGVCVNICMIPYVSICMIPDWTIKSCAGNFRSGKWYKGKVNPPSPCASVFILYGPIV